MKKDYVIKILFVESSLEEAEQIISLLRNTGIAVRPARATNVEQMQAAVNELEPDVVMFDPAITSINLEDAVKVLDAYGRDYSLLGLVNSIDNQVVAELFVHGARGVASRSQPKQLIAVLQREFDSLQTRRQVRRLETALRESERRCDALLDSSTDAIAYVHEGMHVRANQAYLETFGYDSFDDLLGLPVLDMIDSTHADEFKALLRGHARQEKTPSQLTLHARRADGSQFDATVEFAPATFEGEPCLQIVFRRQLVDQAVLEQLQRDPVTGLFNRARMLESIDDAVTAAAKGKKGQSLLLIEPDNWASLVGGIGLGKADELLAGFADRIRMLLGADDVAGMLAEHTLGVVLDSRPDEAIREWIAKLQHSVSNEIFDAGSRSITVTASIGGSLLGEKNANTELLLNQASQALRTAQSLGGSQVELHDPAAREKADEERERYWLELLRNALTGEGLLLYHQQTISLQDAEGDYSEILLRMNGPQGEVLPGFFMPIAEKHGLTGAIDRWVFDQTIKALQDREGQGQQTTFFVKLTAASLQDDTLLAWLGDRLKLAGLKRGQLVLEMTESKVMTLLRPAQEFVNGWKKLGGRFALEQFGSGLNSFQLLNHIDADYLKIDRSYMADLPQHPESQKKVSEICLQAHELKRQTIAEWVEDATSTSLLFACGVDFVQGNFLQQPQRLE
ncbi:MULTISPECIES: EAL domain-containing response regulator [Rhodanobacter]|uniref:EAL domain-containing response regulator n=1 Tax=Rhodanobacter TaxID=75309 RepID=UPI0003F7C90B|nr:MULTISPECIES: GGDEF domain-containing phosphodiesterase [Rhodanobacter]KZC18910.1 diguanylate cyclase [Rhodanobacter denitrificans]UJJ52242.1 EAL domain-containing protein [Rhodanobacter denitrificans]UJM94989.1 EAL domain-containing protein [Rhodanobacter denitrificans]UJM98520.1 EAL domain-containing protein [Rhodanobacter denitrificans]UJN22067.1 EAL domain-containing protein [Rhodanobacter denitrificans]